MEKRYGKDRRVAKRICYIGEVHCEAAGVGRLVTRINDLSVTGAFIDSVICYPVGTILTLRFHIKDVLIETSAEVRYSMQKMGMGLHFLDLHPDHVAALESLIEGTPLILAPPVSDTPDDGDSKPDGSNLPDVLLGNFAVVSMFDVIQVIENNRLLGTLANESPGGKGEIQFNDGHIVGASWGLRTGIDALKSFLGVTEGSFEFKRTTKQYPDTIGARSNMQLMMDLLREKDEDSTVVK